jgi:hypothetical protein
VIAELVRLAKEAKSETARIAAIKELLDRAYGKATQFVAAENDEPSLNDMNIEELRAQIFADVQQIFPGYRLVPNKRLKVISSLRFLLTRRHAARCHTPLPAAHLTGFRRETAANELLRYYTRRWPSSLTWRPAQQEDANL